MLVQPSFELLPSPAFREIGLENRYGGLERGTAQEPGIVVPSLMPIGPVHSAAEPIGHVSKWERVADVQLDLKAWLPPVGGE